MVVLTENYFCSDKYMSDKKARLNKKFRIKGKQREMEEKENK